MKLWKDFPFNDQPDNDSNCYECFDRSLKKEILIYNAKIVTMRAEVSLSINGFNFNIIKVKVKMLRVLRLSQTFTHRLVNFSLMVFLFVLVEVLVHPGLAEVGVAAVLLDAAKPGFEHVIDALLGVPLRRGRHLDVEAGVGRVRLPLHHFVLLE